MLILFIAGCDRELSVSQPEPIPKSSHLDISSKPQGYKIYQNGRIMGVRTPDSLLYLEYGTHTIELKNEIFLDTTILIEIDQEITESVFLDMTTREDFYGKIEVTSSPENAEIILNDSLTGLYTPSVIEHLYPGNYKIDFKKFGFRAPSFGPLVISNETTSCYGILEDTTIWLVYNVNNSDLPSNSLECISSNLQGSGDLWIGSSDAGIIKLDGEHFTHYSLNNSNLPANFIHSISVDKYEHIMAGSPLGAVKYDGIEWVKFSPHNGISLDFVSSIEMISIWRIQNGVYRFFDEYYFSTIGEGIIKLSEGEFDTYQPENLEMSSKNIISTIHTDEIIAIATSDDGLYVSSGKNQNRTWYHYDHTNTGFWDKNGRCIMTAIEMRSITGEMWAATNFATGSGQLFFSEVSQIGEREWIEIDLGFAKVYQIYIDSDKVWVATNKGLFKLQNNVEIADHYTILNSGLPSNSVTGVAIDRSLNVWMTTYNGLVRYAPYKE